jgi:hypothetical protein
LAKTQQTYGSIHGESAGGHSKQASSSTPARPRQPSGDLQCLATEVSKTLQFSLMYHRDTNRISQHISASESLSKYWKRVRRHLLPMETEILSSRSATDCSRFACFCWNSAKVFSAFFSPSFCGFSGWYVLNVSIIFDAPCLFIHHLLCILFTLRGVFMHF